MKFILLNLYPLKIIINKQLVIFNNPPISQLAENLDTFFLCVNMTIDAVECSFQTFEDVRYLYGCIYGEGF